MKISFVWHLEIFLKCAHSLFTLKITLKSFAILIICFCHVAKISLLLKIYINKTCSAVKSNERKRSIIQNWKICFLDETVTNKK